MFLSSRIRSQSVQLVVTLIVFSLASGVLGGVLFYIDSAGPDVLDEMRSKIDVDMEVFFHPEFYTQNSTSLEQIEATISDQETVCNVESLAVVDVYDQDESELSLRRRVILGVDTDFFQSYSFKIRLFPSGPLNNTSCYVLQAYLESAELQIGDNYTASVPVYEGNTLVNRIDHNYTIAGSFDTDLFLHRLTSDADLTSYLYMITTRDGLWNNFLDANPGDYRGIQDRIWIQFETTELTFGDPNQAASLLRNIEKRIEQRTLPYASIERFELVSIMHEFAAWATSMRIIAVAFSIPTVIMGILLVQYNSNLLADERRRNIGVLRTRGASGVQSFSWVLQIVVLTTAIGCFGAIITGLVAALLSGSIREFMLFDPAQLESFRITIGAPSLLGLLAYSFSVGLMIGVPTAIRAYLMKAADAHRVIAADETTKDEKQSNIAVQIGAVTISGLLLIPIMEALSEASLSILSSSLFSVMLVFLLSVFVIGFSMFLSRPAASIKSRIHLGLSHTSFAIGSRILGKTSLTYRRSEMYSVMFVGLVFTTGILSALTATTGNAHMRDLFMYRVGGDIVLDVNPGLQNITNDFLEQIRDIDGVSCATGVLRIGGHVQFWMSWEGRMVELNTTMTIFGVQGEDWIHSAYIEHYFTFFHEPSVSIPKIAENQSNVLASFMPIVGYDRDFLRQSHPIHSDQIRTRIRGPEETHYLNATIVDVMADRTDGFRLGEHLWSQWLGNSYFPGESESYAFIVMDLDYIQQCLSTTQLSRIYVSLEDKSEYQKVIETIIEIAASSFESIDSPYYYIDDILNSRAGQAIYGAYTLNVLFSILFLTAGVTIVVTVKERAMSKHFSLLRALGVESESITKSMVLDTVAVIVLGLAVGLIQGLTLTLLLAQIPITYLGLSTDVAWGSLPLVISIPIELLGTILALAFLFSIMSTYFVVSHGHGRTIAEIIQHSE